MATTPSASTTISAEAGALAGGTGYCTIFACVPDSDDAVARVFASGKGILDTHGYAPGVDYAATHIEGTGQPVIFVGIPIATAGALGREDSSGVTGNSVISVAPGASGYLDEVDAILTVVQGGTVGTSDIRLTLSLDGGVTEKAVRLGTATSYTVPYIGIVISFTADTLAAGDEYTFATTAPKWDSDGIAAAKLAMMAQTKASRSWMIIGDLENSTEAGYVTTAVNAYETAKKRFTKARAQVRDRLPLAEMARATVRMSGTPTITFAEVGGTADTITRNIGSFITDGFATGMVITVSGAVTGSGHNNVTGKITGVSALVLTLDTADLDAEGPISGVSILGSHGLIFTTTTATRSGGSWLADGFRVGDEVTFDGTASNDITVTITVLTATVMTFLTGGGGAETIGTRSVTCTKGETMAQWVAEMDSAFTSVDSQKRINLGLGRLRHVSPITNWSFRRPVQWAASIREYQHDVHHPTWAKEDGPLLDWTNTDEDGTVVEFDQDNDGGGLEGRFTCARTWPNGPNGAFIAMDLTRDTDGALLSLDHNMAVANVCCGIVQAMTENIIGKTLQLNDDGTATQAELQRIEEPVNTALEQALRREHKPGEGPRASKAVWRASGTDILNVADATITGVAELHVNGTIVNVDTLVKIS